MTFPTFFPWLLSLAAATVVVGIAASEPPSPTSPPAPAQAPATTAIEPIKAEVSTGIAVVELFTSEGCSSCPAADEVFAKILAKADKDGAQVYAIAFHVDYWNYLGWKDRFSTAAATDRQRKYAAKFKSSGLYTPQMIVNGAFGPDGSGVQTQFVGSDAGRAEREITSAVKTVAPKIKLTVYPHKTGEPVVAEVAADVLANEKAEVLFAIVENDLLSDVTKGENSGRKLRHDAVVRVFEVAALSEMGTAKVTLTLPNDLVEANTRVIAVVQDQETMRTLGAARSKIEIVK